RNHPGSKLRQGFWMVFRLGVNNWGYKKKLGLKSSASFGLYNCHYKTKWLGETLLILFNLEFLMHN
ncbi:hypothetical protein V2L21_06580, partial [Streptococcus pneumoniae]